MIINLEDYRNTSVEERRYLVDALLDHGIPLGVDGMVWQFRDVALKPEDLTIDSFIVITVLDPESGLRIPEFYRVIDIEYDSDIYVGGVEVAIEDVMTGDFGWWLLNRDGFWELGDYRAEIYEFERIPQDEQATEEIKRLRFELASKIDTRNLALLTKVRAERDYNLAQKDVREAQLRLSVAESY